MLIFEEEVFTPHRYFKNQNKNDVVFAFTYTYGGIRKAKEELFNTMLKGHEDILNYEPKKLWDHYFEDNIYYIDHHQSHATYAFLNSGFDKSDILAIDGIGSKYRCVFFDKAIRERHSLRTDGC